MTELIDELRTALADWDATGPNRTGTAEDGRRGSTAAAWADTLLPLVREEAGTHARVLDAGCGAGMLSRLLAADGHRVTGLENSQRLLDLAGDGADQAELDIEWVKGEATAPPAGPFDAVVSRNLLWTLPDRVSALRAWGATLKPGGVLVLSDAMWGSADHEIVSLDRFNSMYGAQARQLPVATGLNRAAATVLLHRAGFTAITDRTALFDEIPYPDAPGFFVLTARTREA